jgi:hypothetical protein
MDWKTGEKVGQRIGNGLFYAGLFLGAACTGLIWNFAVGGALLMLKNYLWPNKTGRHSFLDFIIGAYLSPLVVVSLWVGLAAFVPMLPWMIPLSASTLYGGAVIASIAGGIGALLGALSRDKLYAAAMFIPESVQTVCQAVTRYTSGALCAGLGAAMNFLWGTQSIAVQAPQPLVKPVVVPSQMPAAQVSAASQVLAAPQMLVAETSRFLSRASGGAEKARLAELSSDAASSSERERPRASRA